ncbi:MAG: TlpA family protein disulfide reductase [Thermodesulfovibrionales bacterium]
MRKRANIIAAMGAIGLVLLVTIVLPSLRKEKTEIAVGKKSPSFTLSSETGVTVNSGEFAGKVVILHYWATWCPPCITELPSLAKLYEAYKGNDKVKFFFVLYQDSEDNAAQYFQTAKIDLPLWFDYNQSTASAFGVTGVPETYVVDSNGILQQRIIGSADWESAEVRRYIDGLLNF